MFWVAYTVELKCIFERCFEEDTSDNEMLWCVNHASLFFCIYMAVSFCEDIINISPITVKNNNILIKFFRRLGLEWKTRRKFV